MSSCHQAQSWAKRPCRFQFLHLRSNDLEELQRALAAGHPVLIGVQVYQRSFMQSQGGVITLPSQVNLLRQGSCVVRCSSCVLYKLDDMIPHSRLPLCCLMMVQGDRPAGGHCLWLVGFDQGQQVSMLPGWQAVVRIRYCHAQTVLLLLIFYSSD